MRALEQTKNSGKSVWEVSKYRLWRVARKSMKRKAYVVFGTEEGTWALERWADLSLALCPLACP